MSVLTFYDFRYFLDETEANSRNYIENYQVKASNSVIHLAKEAEKYFCTEVAMSTIEERI